MALKFFRTLSNIAGPVSAVGLLISGNASADTVLYTDRGAFQAAVPTLATEGFNTSFTDAPIVDFGNFTVNAGFDDVHWTSIASLPQLVSEDIGAIYLFDATQPTTIGNSARFLFDTPISAFGIDINDHSSPRLTVRNNGSLPVTELAAGLPTLFVGFTDTVPFYEVEIFWNRAVDAVGFDYLQYSTSAVVPVPAAFWLFGSGLIGLAGIARRESKKTSVNPGAAVT